MTKPKRLNDWLERIQARHTAAIDLGLARCAEVWGRMGKPRPAPRVITVAGTNGKGSTVAGIESGLAALGFRVGCYTSPHLLCYNERVRIAGASASDVALIGGFEAVETALGDVALTYFEFGTLAAFATMASEGLDYAILEVGLGGRLDAVNIVDADLAVITPIGLDHQDYLGENLEQIGREKAGIMRPAQTVVLSDRKPPESILEQAEALDVRLISIGDDFDVARSPAAPEGAWDFFYADWTTPFQIQMQGRHQADNLAAAMTAVLLVQPTAAERPELVAKAIGDTRVRGRMERVSDQPSVIVDVGHNPMAAAVIDDFLARQEHAACIAVLGMLADKDAEGVASVLHGRVSRWYCGGLEGDRGQTGAQLAGRVASRVGEAAVQSCETVTQALEQALGDVGEEGLVLVFGSFHTAAEAISHLQGANC